MALGILPRHNLETMLCFIAVLSDIYLEPSCFPPSRRLLMHQGENRARPRNGLSLKSLAASLLVHVFAFPFLVFWSVPSPAPIAREKIVDVEIVSLPSATVERTHQSSSPSAGSRRGDAIPEVMPQPKASLPAVDPTTDDAPAKVKPQLMLSEGVLADPRSKDVRKALSQLAAAERVEQLCNLEAMAQVGQWNRRLQPDRVVAYATAATRLNETSFSALGAALHSGEDWYGLQFTCDLAPDGKAVVAFEFVMGDAIPREHWLEFSLPDEVGSLD